MALVCAGPSFIGWGFLCTLTLGIGYLFLEPYYQATMAEFYAALRSKALNLGMSDTNRAGRLCSPRNAVKQGVRFLQKRLDIFRRACYNSPCSSGLPGCCGKMAELV